MTVKKARNVIEVLVSPPLDNNNATTKKIVADLLKSKAGTTYVNINTLFSNSKKYFDKLDMHTGSKLILLGHVLTKKSMYTSLQRSGS